MILSCFVVSEPPKLDRPINEFDWLFVHYSLVLECDSSFSVYGKKPGAQTLNAQIKGQTNRIGLKSLYKLNT